eukprot:GEMP01054752.1.p1 GENE.GEMP01054752.1~~GEMP01054752.1.p1  ORF type:complete len:270 (+),score=46.01 GEMP01054752.1:48-812(+)
MGGDPHSLAQQHVKLAEEHEAKGTPQQLSLAIREYKEAKRLKPRDQSVKDRLKSAVIRYRKISPHQPTIPMLRFASHFNLSLRYWDEGKTDLALTEAFYSITLLESAKLPYGCAEHNLNAMKQLTTKYRAMERGLITGLRHSRSIKNMYRLGVLLFDKRMLHKAEDQLRKTEDMLKAALALAKQRKDDEELQRFRDDHEGVLDDLSFCRKLRLTMSQTEGPLLPCLTHRFDAPQASCIRWMEDLSSRTNIDWRV